MCYCYMLLSHLNLFENYQTLPHCTIELQAAGIIFLYQGNILQLLFLGTCLILKGTGSLFCMSGCENKSCLGRSSNLSHTWPIFHFLGWTCKFLILTSRTEALCLSRTWLQQVLCFVSSSSELFPFFPWVVLFACWDSFRFIISLSFTFFLFYC